MFCGKDNLVNVIISLFKSDMVWSKVTKSSRGHWYNAFIIRFFRFQWCERCSDRQRGRQCFFGGRCWRLRRRLQRQQLRAALGRRRRWRRRLRRQRRQERRRVHPLAKQAQLVERHRALQKSFQVRMKNVSAQFFCYVNFSWLTFFFFLCQYL